MAETVEIPFLKDGNKQILTDIQIAEMPWLMEFIERFSNCFEYDYVRAIYVFYPSGK